MVKFKPGFHMIKSKNTRVCRFFIEAILIYFNSAN